MNKQEQQKSNRKLYYIIKEEMFVMLVKYLTFLHDLYASKFIVSYFHVDGLSYHQSEPICMF